MAKAKAKAKPKAAKPKAKAKVVAKPKVKAKAKVVAKPKAKAPATDKREYKTAESAAKQKVQYEKRGFKVSRKGNVLYIKKA